MLFRERFFTYAAPALLATVAVTQLWLAHAKGLSAWKGGGFGMFSTVDSPSGRFLRAYLTTGDREIPVQVPESLSLLAAECRTLPSRERLLRLATGMAAGTWVPYEVSSAVAHYEALSARHGGGDLSGAAGTGDPPLQTGIGDLLTPSVVKSLGLLRMDEGKAAPGVAVDFRGLRVEVWRSEFEPQRPHLRAKRLLEVSVSRPSP